MSAYKFFLLSWLGKK